MKPTLLLVALLVTAAPTAVAGQWDGNDLLRKCTQLLVPSPDNVLPTVPEAFQQGLEQGECLGRVAGISSVGWFHQE